MESEREYCYYVPKKRGAFIASMQRKTPVHEVQIRRKLQVLSGDNPILANYIFPSLCFRTFSVDPNYAPFSPLQTCQGTRPSSQAAAACSKLCASGEISAAGIRVRRIWSDCSHSFGLQAPAEAKVKISQGKSKWTSNGSRFALQAIVWEKQPWKKKTFHVLWLYWHQPVISGNV